MSLSAGFKPSARRILRLVSIRQGMPFSILVMVIGETCAFLASSALLINIDSRVSFKLFALIDLAFRVKQRLCA